MLLETSLSRNLMVRDLVLHTAVEVLWHSPRFCWFKKSFGLLSENKNTLIEIDSLTQVALY